MACLTPTPLVPLVLAVVLCLWLVSPAEGPIAGCPAGMPASQTGQIVCTSRFELAQAECEELYNARNFTEAYCRDCVNYRADYVTGPRRVAARDVCSPGAAEPKLCYTVFRCPPGSAVSPPTSPTTAMTVPTTLTSTTVAPTAAQSKLGYLAFIILPLAAAAIAGLVCWLKKGPLPHKETVKMMGARDTQPVNV